MAIHETYSKRQKRLRGEFNDVYQYDDIPPKLRFQVAKIYEALFDIQEQFMNSLFGYVKNAIESEFGRLLEYSIHGINRYNKKSSDTQILIMFAVDYSNTEEFLDILELVIDRLVTQPRVMYINVSLPSLVEEINFRFRENAIGYQIDPESLKIIRVDSQFVHSEVVKPTLTILNSDSAYAGTLDEFMLAHEHYRHQKFKDAILNCGKSFESMLKAIHEKRGWAYDKHKDTANKLILSCVEKGLFPSFQQDQLMQVGKILECGVPTIRNKTAGHGQGHEVTEVPEHLVSYMIHLTATNLLFLARSDEAHV